MKSLHLGIAMTALAGFVVTFDPALAHRQVGAEARGARAAPAIASGASRTTLCVVGGMFHGLADVWNDPDPRIRASLVTQYPARVGQVRPGSRYCE